jgi:hypothetical protein
MAAVQVAFLSDDTPEVVMRKFGSEPWFEPDFHEPDRGPVQGSGYWLNWTDGPVQRSPFLECIERFRRQHQSRQSHSVHTVDVSDFLL